MVAEEDEDVRRIGVALLRSGRRVRQPRRRGKVKAWRWQRRTRALGPRGAEWGGAEALRAGGRGGRGRGLGTRLGSGQVWKGAKTRVGSWTGRAAFARGETQLVFHERWFQLLAYK